MKVSQPAASSVAEFVMCASRPKKRALRKTEFIQDSDSEEETAKEKPEDPHKSKQEHIPSTHELVETVKCWQNMRKRPPGVSAEALLTGRKVELTVAVDDDPFKMKTGGLVEMKGTFRKPLGDEFEDEVRLSKTFAAETNKRDEDADMLKYIEDELAKRKGIAQKNEDAPKNPADTLLAEIPDFLKPSIGQQSEDMLSNQMLCGIPEVDLGVEAKMRNIEATEEAKQRLLKERFNERRKRQAADIVPANISVNFVQHSRWNNYIDPSVQQELASQFRDLPDASQPVELAIPPLADPPALEAERRRLQAERSTDALVLQRFKNYMRGRRAR